jgi:hypothetical protein
MPIEWNLWTAPPEASWTAPPAPWPGLDTCFSRADQPGCRRVRNTTLDATSDGQCHEMTLVASRFASNTGLTSDDDLAISFRISAVAACCSRARFNSSLKGEVVRRFERTAACMALRFVLSGFWTFANPALRPLAAIVLPLILDGRAIYPQGSTTPSYVPNLHSGRAEGALILLVDRIDVRFEEVRLRPRQPQRATYPNCRLGRLWLRHWDQLA